MDLSVEIIVGANLTLTAKNEGTATAYGVPVVRYEVQRLDGSSWTSLDDGVTENVYVDAAPSGGGTTGCGQ